MLNWSKEKKEKIESEEKLYQPLVEEIICVTYMLRNGKSWDYNINYSSKDYHNVGDYEAAIAAMNKDVVEKQESIEALVQENLGQETGWIKLGNSYIANRDLATVNIRVVQTTRDWMDW